MTQSSYETLERQFKTLAGLGPGEVAKTGWENLETDENGLYILPPGVSLNDLSTLMNALLSEFNLGELVPDDLFSKNVRIAALALTKGSVQAHTNTTLRLTLAWDVRWDLEILQVSGPQVQLLYTQGYAESTLSGLLTLGEGDNAITMSVAIDFPSGTVTAQLTGTEAQSKPAATIFKQFTAPPLPQPHNGAQGPHLTGLKLLANVRDKIFVTHVGVGNIMLRQTQVSGKDVVLEIADLQGDLYYRGGAQGQVTGQLWATLLLGLQATPLRLSLLAAKQDNGWLFGGALSGTGGQAITLKEMVDDLTALFGVSASAPSELNTLSLVGLSVSFDTATKDFSFRLETKFPADGSADLKFMVDFTHTGNDSYVHTFSGTLTVGKQEFDIIFSQQGNNGQTASYFIADYQNLGGPQLTLGTLLKELTKDATVTSFADNIDIDLKAALLAYVAAQGTKKSHVLLTANLGFGVDLTNLPLVNRLFPSANALGVQFQPVLATNTTAQDHLDATTVDALNALVPNGAITLPNKAAAGGDTGGIEQTFQLLAKLKIGDQLYDLNSSLGTAATDLQTSYQNDQPIAAAPQVDATPVGNGAQSVQPPATTGDATWYDVQKSLGPVHFQRVGILFDSTKKEIWFLLDASLSAIGLALELNGLGAGVKLSDIKNRKFDPDFTLRGVGLDFKEGAIEIGGEFLHNKITPPGAIKPIDSYDGMLRVQFEKLTLAAIGSYSRFQGHTSVFVYLTVDYPLGGPAFFFVTGLAGGFGYNRDLLMPPIEGVKDFPLVAEAITPAGNAEPAGGQSRFDRLNTEITKLQSYIPPRIGQYFLAVGLRYTSFELFDSFTLLAVEFGKRLEFDLLGITSAALPTPEGGSSMPRLAEVQIALKATLIPSEGILTVQAQLTRNSYIFSRKCLLTGGLAFFAWFKDQSNGARAGDFVFTIGGYHKKYQPPDYYPRVPQLGFSWQVSDLISVKGNAYFALTPNAMMAGGHLEALWKSGALSAWFKAGADFLLGWKPFHYDGEIYVSIGASLTFHFFGTHHVTVELGGDLHLWGPEFSGKVKIHYYIISATVSFGSAKPEAKPLTWAQFRDSFLPKGKGSIVGDALPDNIASLAVNRGLVNTVKADGQPESWVMNPKEFALSVDSPIPVTAPDGFKPEQPPDDPTPDDPAYRLTVTDFGLAPMGVTGVTSTMKIDIKHGTTAANDSFRFKPIKKAMPAAMWGNEFKPNLNGNRTIADLCTGFTITPKNPPAALHTQPIDKANLAYEDADAPTHRPLPQPVALTPSLEAQVASKVASKTVNQRQAVEAVRAGIDRTILDQTVVATRNDLLAALGFADPMSETTVDSHLADAFIIA